MRCYSFIFLLCIFSLFTLTLQAKTDKKIIENQQVSNQILVNPIEPNQQLKHKKLLKKLLKKQHPQLQNDSMFPNSFAWTGVVLLIIGLFMGLIFGGTLGTIATVLAAVGLIFVVVWIIQRLSYM